MYSSIKTVCSVSTRAAMDPRILLCFILATMPSLSFGRSRSLAVSSSEIRAQLASGEILKEFVVYEYDQEARPQPRPQHRPHPRPQPAEDPAPTEDPAVAAPAPEPAVAPAAPVEPVYPSELAGGKHLASGDCLQSPNKAYKACMQVDGNFVVYQNPSTAIWQSATNLGTQNTYTLAFENVQGLNLVVYQTNQPKSLWRAFKSCGKGIVNGKLAMQDDGNLVLYDATNKAVWSTKTGPIPYQSYIGFIKSPATLYANDCIKSNNGVYMACLQGGAGNFVVQNPNGLWWTGMNRPASESADFRMELQGDGNFVFYSTPAGGLWQTQSYNKGPAPYTLHMQDDSNLVIYNAAGTAIWGWKNGGLIGPPGK